MPLIAPWAMNLNGIQEVGVQPLAPPPVPLSRYFVETLQPAKPCAAVIHVIHKPSTLSLGGMGRPAHDFV